MAMLVPIICFAIIIFWFIYTWWKRLDKQSSATLPPVEQCSCYGFGMRDEKIGTKKMDVDVYKCALGHEWYQIPPEKAFPAYTKNMKEFAKNKPLE